MACEALLADLGGQLEECQVSRKLLEQYVGAATKRENADWQQAHGEAQQLEAQKSTKEAELRELQTENRRLHKELTDVLDGLGEAAGHSTFANTAGAVARHESGQADVGIAASTAENATAVEAVTGGLALKRGPEDWEEAWLACEDRRKALQLHVNLCRVRQRAAESRYDTDRQRRQELQDHAETDSEMLHQRLEILDRQIAQAKHRNSRLRASIAGLQ